MDSLMLIQATAAPSGTAAAGHAGCRVLKSTARGLAAAVSLALIPLFAMATLFLLAMLFSVAGPNAATAGEHFTNNVPPTLEIEVLDPGVDPKGNPAVIVKRDDLSGDVAKVDIPPVILVHRFYYTGDRSFQGPMLPGGPSIAVLNHPQTGERCYIPLQMMPGAPRVTYSKHGVEYDYGTHATTICFAAWSGKPTIKYRSGKTWTQKAAALVHAEELKDCVHKVSEHCAESCARSATVMKGAVVQVGGAAKTVSLPVRNTLQVMPFGKRLFSGDTADRLAQRAAEHDREHAIRKVQRENERDEFDYRTNR